MKERKFLPELEGIRAYALIVVFCVHYTDGLLLAPDGPGVIRYLWFLFTQISWVAVPIFFVLSGYLITGILYDTQDRKGFFRVFYARRALRILPAYYLVLLLVLVLGLITHSKLIPEQLWFFVYLHNLCNMAAVYFVGRDFALGHLWSLAVEEQFYLVWPVAVWLIRDRVSLLRCCYLVTAGSCLLRIAWPLFHLGINFAYSCTFTRCDAIMLGCALALHQRAEGFDMRRLAAPARWVTLGAVALFYAKVVVYGHGIPVDYIGVAVLIPLINVIALGIVILCLTPGTTIQRLCRVPWACSLGMISYGLYMLHYICQPVIQERLALAMVPRFGHFLTRILIVSSVWIVTYALARLMYRYVEMPALRWKDKFHYGAKANPTQNPLAEPPPIGPVNLRLR